MPNKETAPLNPWLKWMLRAICALVLLNLILRTWEHQMVWLDDVRLWRHVIEHNPQAPDAHLSLAFALMKQGRYEEVLMITGRLMQEDPSQMEGYLVAVRALKLLGLEEAESSLGWAYMEEAEYLMRKALEIDSRHAGVYSDLGAILFYQRRYTEAHQATQKALALEPGHPEARKNLEAIRVALAAQEVKP